MRITVLATGFETRAHAPVQERRESLTTGLPPSRPEPEPARVPADTADHLDIPAFLRRRN